MSQIVERDFHRAVKNHDFAPVYYIYGSNDFLKEEAVRSLVSGAVDQATRDFNFDAIRSAELNGERLEAILNTPPLMAPRRMVVLRDVGALKKDARAVLEGYLTRPAPDLVLVMVSGPDDKEDAILINAAAATLFDALDSRRLPKWIVHHTTSALGSTIDAEAVDFLVQTVGSDLPHLARELEKAASYSGGAVTRRALEEVIGVQHGETVGDLLDAVLERDTGRALVLLPTILMQPKQSAVTLLMAFTTQILAVAFGRAAQSRGTANPVLERAYFSMLRDARAFPGRPYGEAVRAWVRAIARWPETDLDRALHTLLEADRMAKESRLSSEEQLLTGVILTICGPGVPVTA